MTTRPPAGRYVPPHLRHLQPAPAPEPTAGPSTSTSTASSSSSSRTRPISLPPSAPDAPVAALTPPTSLQPPSSSQSMLRSLSHSRTPWSRPDTSSSSSSSSTPNLAYSQPGRSPQSNGSRPTSPSKLPVPLPQTDTRTISPQRPRPSAPSLYVFGDSFVGPFKLLRDECARVQTFKGSSAKGLNNPNSIKQVSSDLVPILNNLLAPPPYAYIPQVGRFALLIFGNVDLQINYLWQLQNKPITSQTFSLDPPKPALNGHGPKPVVNDSDSLTASPSEDILANATETSLRGPALGPERFVDTVLREYTIWLEREIVEGPIGKRAKELSSDDSTQSTAQSTSSGATGSTSTSSSTSASARRRAGPCRVIIAGALPPLVTDETLPRIPEKYVERLEDDHTRAHKAMERAAEPKSRTPWALSAGGSGSQTGGEEQVPEEVGSDGVSTVEVSDSTKATGSEAVESRLPEAAPAVNGARAASIAVSAPPATKTSIQTLLQHDPPLCTKSVRVSMTARFNAGLKSFCDKYPHILSFVDITDLMLADDASSLPPLSSPTSTSSPSLSTSFVASGEVDRATWACPVDPSNIHPLWEPTLPLWLRALESLGVPTGQYAITDDAEETFKAYEVDKRRRTEESQFGGISQDVERLKIRDE